METERTYFHDYQSCSRTYATLCIYHDDLIPSEITKLLGVEPSHSQKKGDINENRKKGHIIKVGGWFLGTQGTTDSRDFRYHIDILLREIKQKKDCLILLREQGYKIHISCFWESATGNGGPFLDCQLMSVLGELGIDIHFDIWFDLDYLAELPSRTYVAR